MTFRRAVVGTDGSDTAMRAVDHAARLAGKLTAELVVAHAHHPSSGARRDRERVTAAYDIGASILRDASTWFGDRVRMRPLLREGPAAEALIAAARDEDADLVVVGNKGLETRRLPIGSVPARVARGAPCSVLIVHTTDSVDAEPYSKVLLATNGSPSATRAVAVGAALAEAVGAEARVLHVGDPATGSRILGEAGRSLALPALGRTVTGDPAERIVEVAREERCDLIVVGARARPGARRFLGRVPRLVARRAPGHVLLVKPS